MSVRRVPKDPSQPLVGYEVRWRDGAGSSRRKLFKGQAKRAAANRILPATLLNHSHRTYVFGRALGELDRLEVDSELLFAAALLHDTGLVLAGGHDDFTHASTRVAQDVAEQVGLSTMATETLQTAITMHYNPRVPLAAGPVAYLISAGAGVDVAGMRSWDLPPRLLADAVRDHPRNGFKAYFTRAWADEAARVEQGRAKLLRRYARSRPRPPSPRSTSEPARSEGATAPEVIQ